MRSLQKNKKQYTKQEIAKPSYTSQYFACQTLALFSDTDEFFDRKATKKLHP
jgi:hypothetical protein